MTSFLESLEQRIAPASLINPKTVTFKDVDGDTIEVTVTKGTLSLDAFTFIAGDGDSEILSLLDLSDPIFAGTSLSIKAIAGPDGDGHVNIGKISALGNDLGKVAIGGGLLAIDAGDNATPQKGLAGLTADSLGTLNPSDFGLTNHNSSISGKLGTLNISGEIGANLIVSGGDKAGIGSITIGGSFIAGPSGQKAWIETTGSIGKINITGGIDGRLSDAANSAGIKALGKIGKTAIGGSIYGGEFENTGGIFSTGSLASLTIAGSLVGGAGTSSGAIKVLDGDLGKVFITGSVQGGSGDYSGSILNFDGKTASLSVGENIEGGAGKISGTIFSLRGLGSLSITGGLHGGTGNDAGSIQTGPAQAFTGGPGGVDTSATGNIGKVFIGENVSGNDGLRSGAILAWGSNMGQVQINGSIIGGDGQFSALVYGTNNFSKITVGHDLIGGDGAFSGRIATDVGNLGPVTIGGEVKGGGGDSSATIFAGSNIGKISIANDLTGGEGDYSGSIGITPKNPLTVYSNNIGAITIGGQVAGGAGEYSGSIVARAAIAAVSIHESLLGGAGGNSGSIIAYSGSIGQVGIGEDLIGGGGANSAWIAAAKNIAGVSVGHDMVGGGGIGSGFIQTLAGLGSLDIGHDLKGGTSASSGFVSAVTRIGSVSITGSLIGTDHSNTGSILVSGNQNVLGTIKSIFIGGNIEGGNNPNGDVFSSGLISTGSIGSVHVVGDIIAGERVDTNKLLGDSGAIRAYGSIGKITVDGSLVGNETNSVIISARLQYGGSATNNVVLGKIDIGGDVTHSLILAGVNSTVTPSAWNPLARIGSITVGGKWTASSAAAGVNPGPDDGDEENGDSSGYGYGDTSVKSPFDDIKIPPGNHSRIGSISISGEVTDGNGIKQYGFAAGSFGSITIGGNAQTLPAIGQTTDITANGKMKIHRVLAFGADPAS